MQNPLISIVIPTFNSEENIDACFASIFEQTYSGWEIIVVDGLSTDNTISIVKTCASKHPFIHWTSEPDAGVYDAMNKGIGMSKGRWLYFLGSDDTLFDDQVFAKIALAIQDNPCDVLYGDVKMTGESSWAGNGAIYDGPFSREKLFIKNICHQAIFYNRIVFEKIGVFNTDYKVCADWDFNHRCFASLTISYVNIVVANFFAGGLSTQKRSDAFTNEDFVLNLKQYYRLSYFNRIFKSSAWRFNNVSHRYAAKGKILASLYFLLFAWIHSDNKMSLIKNYVHSALLKR